VAIFIQPAALSIHPSARNAQIAQIGDPRPLEVALIGKPCSERKEVISIATEIWTYHDQRLAALDLTGFEVETRDGVIGRVDRATEDVAGSYLVIDPGRSMPLGRRVVVPAGIVDTVDLDDRRLLVNTGRDEILSGPEFDPERALDESLRDRIGAHFAPREQPSSQQQQQPRRQSSSTSRRRSSPTRRRSRPTQTDEPTKGELYKQAQRLGIEGRSKMNKSQLKRAVQRRSK
jgi:hypothetical protein